MRLELLSIFLNVLDSGSLAAAARLTHMSQPSVSAALSVLESEVGQALLMRTPGQRKPIRPTPAGEVFAQYAQKALTDYQAMRAALMTASGEVPGPVRIGVTPSPGSAVLPVLAQRFREVSPSIQLQVRTFSGAEIFRRLKLREYDLAITGTHPQEDGLAFDRFFYDPVVLICPGSFGIHGPISLRRLRTLPLVVRHRSSGNLMRLLSQALERAGVSFDSLNVVMQVSGNNDVLSSVALGAGAGFIARSLLAAGGGNAGVEEVPVKRLRVDRYLYLVRRENAPFTGGLRLFWEFALSMGWRENIFAYNTLLL